MARRHPRRQRSRHRGREGDPQPADRPQRCLLDVADDKINEVFGYQLGGRCETLFPTYGDTRTAAGGGLTADTLKCQVKPLDLASYPVTFTAGQQARLAAIFSTGVCDWSKPGVDELPPLGTWLDHGP